MELSKHQRDLVREASTIVIKIGSRVLVERTGHPDLKRIRSLVKEIAAIHKGGKKVIVVTSGAIAAGVEALGMKTRPKELPRLQMAAAVGQVRLMTLYDKFFEAEGIRIGQLLLTHADLQHRARHLNARHTLSELLTSGVIPVINENDVVAVDEIKFGDNDILGALVTILVNGDVLILLSTTDGLRAPTGGGRTRRVPYLERVTPETLALAFGKGSEFSVGGMASKLQSAQTAADVGAQVIIADGSQPNVISDVLQGKDVGTLIGSPRFSRRGLRGRKQWLAFFHKVQGGVVVDSGAQRALAKGGYSLLPIGVCDVEGHFPRGSLVNVKDGEGHVIARGLAEYSSEEIRKIMGRRTSEIAAILGAKDCDEMIHRDNMVVLSSKEGSVHEPAR